MKKRERPTYNELAERYGFPPRTLINMKQRGWNIYDPVALWDAIMKSGHATKRRRCSLDKLAELAGKTQELDQQVTENQESESLALTSGIMAELRRLKREVQRAYNEYTRERRPGDKLLRQREYLNLIKELRLLAKEAPKAEREAGNVLTIGDVDATWRRALIEFKNAIELLGRRIATNPLFAKLNPVDVEQEVNKETTTILARLQTAGEIQDDASGEITEEAS